MKMKKDAEAIEKKAVGGQIKGAKPGKFKKGGAVGGKALVPSVARRARGGRMTPSSPLSGAEAPNLGYAKSKLRKVDDGGMGKDSD